MPEFGYIYLSRKTFATDELWLEPRVFSRWEAWVDLIQMAAWHQISRSAKGSIITLERGEFVASIRFLARRWSWSVKRIRLGLKRAQDDGRIRAQRETVLGMVYHIVNYDIYQAGEKVPDIRRAQGPPGQRAQRGHSEGTARAQIEGRKEGKNRDLGANGTSPHITDEPPIQWEN